MNDLEGKVVLITGGSRGIGAAIASAFAEKRARIAITYRRNKNQAERCSNEIRKRGRECLLQRADVSRLRDVRKVVKNVVDTYGRIDVLINNAGIWKEGTIGSMTEKQWDETIEANLKGTFRAQQGNAESPFTPTMPHRKEE
jgi:NAD(P)-dependent dehydrogenase (short-subunit alcohol dehydrogenase family)